MRETLQTRVLAVIIAGAVLIAIDGSTLYPILSSIQSSFGIDERISVWIFNIEILFLMLGTPVIARLSDVYGRKRTYVFSACLFLLGTITVTLSPSFSLLLAGRALQGAGAGISVLAITLIGDHFTENRGTVLGVFGVVIGLIYALGPALSGFLVPFGWHWVFALNLPVAAAVVALAFFLLPEDTKKGNVTTAHFKNMLFLGIAIVSFAVFINNLNQSVGEIPSWIFLLPCIVSLILYWQYEKTAENPVLPIHLLKRRNAMITGMVTVIGYVASAGTYFLSTFAILAFGLDYAQGAFMVIPFSVSSLIGTLIVGKLLDTTGPRPVMIVGGCMAAAGVILLSVSQNPAGFGIAMVLLGIGNAAVAGNVLYYLMLGETNAKDRASGQALLNLLLNAGALIGGSLFGAVLSGPGGIATYRTVYFYLAFIYVVLVILALCLKTKPGSLAEGTGQDTR